MKSKGSEKVQDPKPANGGAPRTKGMEVRLERLAGQADGCRVSSFLSTRSLKFLCPGGGGGGGRAGGAEQPQSHCVEPQGHSVFALTTATT